MVRCLLLAVLAVVVSSPAGEGPTLSDATEVTVNLKVLERLACVRLLPEKGSFLQMQLSKGLQKKLGFESAEIEQLKMVEKEGRLQWDAAKDTGREIKLARGELTMLKEALRAADEKKEVTADMLKLYETIMGAR